jgi:hypothetical protein
LIPSQQPWEGCTTPPNAPRSACCGNPPPKLEEEGDELL